MACTVRMGGTIEVRADGREIPSPDRAVATLLMGLLAAGEDWTPRAEVARRLYPDSDPAAARNALRQAFFRLRRWLGTETLECRSDLVRLTPGTVTAVWEAEVAVWLDHPWANAIRDARRPHEAEPRPGHFEAFSRAVESTAEFDRDAARGILVGGMALALNLPYDVGLRLVRLTAPVNARSPFAFEHLDLCGEMQLQTMALDRVRETYLRAYRLGVHRRSAAQAFRAASMSTFAHIEAGDMVGAAAWLQRCSSHCRTASPLLINARAAFLWNSDRADEAVELMRGSMPRADASDPFQRLHYWTNFAVLASESGDLELSIRADEEARRLASPSVHLASLRTLDFARASRLMSQGLLDESLGAFRRIRSHAEGIGNADHRAYAAEGYAEALARAGETRQAVEVWSRAEARRHATNARLTPRLAARKARILRNA